MASLDLADHPLAAILRDAFAAQIEVGAVDLVITDQESIFEVQSDEWTLRIEGWPIMSAFIALDHEPSSLAARRAALDAALNPQHLAGLRRMNCLLNNALATALEDSGDQLSVLLAQAVTSPGEQGDDEVL